MPQMQGNALEISLDFQFGPIPAIFSAHAPGGTDSVTLIKRDSCSKPLCRSGA